MTEITIGTDECYIHEGRERRSDRYVITHNVHDSVVLLVKGHNSLGVPGVCCAHISSHACAIQTEETTQDDSTVVQTNLAKIQAFLKRYSDNLQALCCTNDKMQQKHYEDLQRQVFKLKLTPDVYYLNEDSPNGASVVCRISPLGMFKCASSDKISEDNSVTTYSDTVPC